MFQVFESKGKYQGIKVKSLLSTYFLSILISKLSNTFLTQFLHFSNRDNNTAVSFRGLIRCFESFDTGRRHQAMKMQKKTVMLKSIHRSMDVIRAGVEQICITLRERKITPLLSHDSKSKQSILTFPLSEGVLTWLLTAIGKITHRHKAMSNSWRDMVSWNGLT